MNPALVEIMQRCTCGHGAYCHAITEPNKAKLRTRGFCCHGDETGICHCKRFVKAVSDG